MHYVVPAADNPGHVPCMSAAEEAAAMVNEVHVMPNIKNFILYLSANDYVTVLGIWIYAGMN